MGLAARGQAPLFSGMQMPEPVSNVNWLARMLTLHFWWAAFMVAMARTKTTRPVKRGSTWITSSISSATSNQTLW